MIHIEGKTINELVYNCLDKIIIEGNRTSSRNGDVSSLYNVFAELENPRSRHLGLAGRNNNIFATIAETFWVFAGHDKVDPFLSFYLPRAVDFSDDGQIWRGAYGPRLYEHNQLDDIVEQFRNEGIFTRRATLYIGASSLDTKESLNKVYDIEKTKDKPCNMVCDFYITPDKKLHMNVKSRSGDVLWGFGSINIFEWSFLQEFILQQLKREVDSEITLGTYNHHVTNLHLYDFSGDQGYKVLEQRLGQRLGVQNYQHLIFPKDCRQFKMMNSKIVSILSEAIIDNVTDYKRLRLDLGSTFDVYELPQEDNLLWKYVEIIAAYLCAKNMKLPKGEKTQEFDVDLRGCDDEFKQSINNSIFRKFEIII